MLNTITVDKLHFQFNYLSDIDSLNFLKCLLEQNYNLLPYLNNNYYKSYHIYTLTDNLYLGILNLGLKISKNNFCTINFSNQSLYSYIVEVKTLYNYLNTLKVTNLFIKNLEIAIDSNYNYIKRYNRLIKANNLMFSKNYKGFYYGKEYDNQYIRDVKNETKYIINKKNRFDSKKENDSNQQRYIRIENKHLTLKDIPKPYIKNYLNSKGFNVSNNHYRVELVLSGLDSFKSSTDTLYYNIFGEYITKYKRDKAIKYLKDNDSDSDSIFDFKVKEYQIIISEFSKKEIIKKYLDFDINQLTDKDYLLSIFYNYSAKMLDINKLVNLKYKNKELKMKTKEIIKRDNKSTQPKIKQTPLGYIIETKGVDYVQEYINNLSVASKEFKQLFY